MQLYKAIKNSFGQLCDVIGQLDQEQYTMQISALFNATIGQHTRHIIELFIELNNGYVSGVVNYDNRKRDYRIETDLQVAVELLESIAAELYKSDKRLLLAVSYDEVNDEVMMVETNYLREVIYNLEHTVHHLALIRVGVNHLSTVEIPENFGIASSTIKYKQSCAQ